MRIVSAKEPFSVPAGRTDSLVHLFDGFPGTGSLVRLILDLGELCILFAVLYEHTADEDRLRNRSLGRTEGLEGFARMFGEAVEIQAVVPVCAPDQRQTVRPQMREREVKRSLQMLHERCRSRPVVVVGNLLVENRIVAGLTRIGADSRNQPQRVIIETGADACIALLGQRLILMICRAVLKLCRSDIDDSLSCALRDQMYETKQILAGIAEAHAASDTGLEVGCRA